MNKKKFIFKYLDSITENMMLTKNKNRDTIRGIFENGDRLFIYDTVGNILWFNEKDFDLMEDTFDVETIELGNYVREYLANKTDIDNINNCKFRMGSN